MSAARAGGHTARGAGDRADGPTAAHPATGLATADADSACHPGSPAHPARRRWLQGAAAAITVAFVPGCALPVIPRRPSPGPEDAMGWIRHEDGRYTLFVPRVEMGQHIGRALQRIAAEALGVPPAAVALRLHSTGDIRPVRATVGSDSVKDFAQPLAAACGVLREALLRRESAPAGLPESARGPEAGPAAAGDHDAAATAEGRTAADRALVVGAPVFVSDVRRPGMVHGRVLRAAVSPELASRLLSADEAAARRVPGFVALVRDRLLSQGRSEGLGIVARTPGALDRIEQALAAQWSVDGRFEAADLAAAIDIDRRLAGNGRLAHAVHAAGRVAAEGPWDVDLRFDIPLAAHAPMEPRAAVAEVAADGALSLWVGSQDVFYQRDVVARRLALRTEQVQVQGLRVGGAFGGKTICTVELEAAVLARATGLPVKLQWTRAQEFRQGFHRPPSSHRVRVRLTDGRLQQWWHAFASSHILFTNAVLPPWLQRLTDFIGDDGVARGATLPYDCPARRTEFDLVRLPVLTGPWRGLGAGPNGFVLESVIDACARAARVDALAFRLAHLDAAQEAGRRLAGVLRRAAEAAGWGRPMPAPRQGHRHGRGLAAGIYKGSSHAAVVAEVEVDTASGAVRVTRLVCAHDCGRVIDADGVRAQCEGNLVWGLGMVLGEEMTVAAGAIATTTLADYAMPRAAQVPAMQVEQVDSGDAPGGAGETAIVAAGAAIANAVHDAIGLRVQRLPLRPADVRAALQGGGQAGVATIGS
jgi:isoquinoline 1-oxidoreductase subunit beta